MIDFGRMWAIARAEMRLTRRIVRFWVFSILAALFCSLVYVQLWVVHFFFSAQSASAASAYPRFFMGAFGSNFLFVMMFGLVFLGFDLRAPQSGNARGFRRARDYHSLRRGYDSRRQGSRRYAGLAGRSQTERRHHPCRRHTNRRARPSRRHRHATWPDR